MSKKTQKVIYVVPAPRGSKFHPDVPAHWIGQRVHVHGEPATIIDAIMTLSGAQIEVTAELDEGHSVDISFSGSSVTDMDI